MIRRTKLKWLRPAKALIVLTLLLSFSKAWSMVEQDAQEIIETLEKVQSYSYKAVNAYYQFSISEGDMSLYQDVTQASENLAALVKQLPGMPGADEMGSEIATLQVIWEEYNELLETNVKDMVDQGYADLRLVSELATANHNLATGAGIAIEQAVEYGKVPSNEVRALIHRSRLMVLVMMTRYAARSASTVSQVFQGDTEESVEDQAQKLDDDIRRLAELVETDPAQNKIMMNILSKWNFMRDSFVNISENSVPYVVNLYSSKMVKQLDELESLQ